MRARIAAAAVSAGLELFEFEDLGVLGGLDPLDAGLEPGGLGITVGGGVGVGGRELGGQQGGAAGSEDAVSEELADDLVQQEFRGLDGARVVRMVGSVLGGGGVVRAPVVGRKRSGLAVGGAGHPAAAVPAADAGPVGVEPPGGRVAVQLVAVAAGAVPGRDVLGGIPRGPVHDRGVHGGR
jgi:hypothetical protein